MADSGEAPEAVELINFKVSAGFLRDLDIHAEWLHVTRSDLLRSMLMYASSNMPSLISDGGWTDPTPPSRGYRRRRR